jgi:ribosomal protein L40E
MRPAEISGAAQECVECHSVLTRGARFCGACGCNDLRPQVRSRFPYDAIAAFIGVISVILFWLVRA